MKKTRKTILITGVNKGIGNGLARKFIKLGHDVIGTARKEISIDGIKAIYKLDLNNNNSILENN